MAFISEADVEAALLDQLSRLQPFGDSIAGPDGSAPERASYSDVVLMDRLKRAMDRLNPDIPSEARQDALKKVIADETPSLIGVFTVPWSKASMWSSTSRTAPYAATRSA